MKKYKILTFIFSLISLSGFGIGALAGYGEFPFSWFLFLFTWFLSSTPLIVLWIWSKIF
tara:strand:- start:623 stop:799 length:177 start_codon:yes stop_codon:yes gene_type:complete